VLPLLHTRPINLLVSKKSLESYDWEISS